MPLISLIGFGIYALIDYNFWIYFLGSWILLALITAIPLIFIKKIKQSPVSIEENDLVKPSEAWSDFDLQTWHGLEQAIFQLLEKDSSWEILKDHSLEIIHKTAGQYNGFGKRRELAFSIPELLLMVEELSRRYRSFLLTHVPFIENIELSQLKMGYDNKKRIQKTYTSAAWLHNIFRVARLVNFPTAIASELRSRVLSVIYNYVNNEVQLKLKRALLLEVAYVSIDLFGGRYKVSDVELPSSQIEKNDLEKIAAPLDPLRIAMVGQVSSGKTSVVNALTGSIVAEVNQLPSTNQALVYNCRLEDIDALKIVDLPGLDGETTTHSTIFNEVINSDLVIWVLKANQPARTLDSELLCALDDHYSQKKNETKKRPIIIGVLNQVDRLKPTSEWAPPYDLKKPTDKKSRVINEALTYNQELFGFKTLIPLSVGEDKEHFNLNELKYLIDKFFNEAIQTQLNRRRCEAASGVDLPAQFSRVFHAGKSLFRL